MNSNDNYIESESEILMSTNEMIQELTKKIDDLSQRVQFLENNLNDSQSIMDDDQFFIKEKKKFSWVGEFLFYVFLVFIVLGLLLIKTNSSGRPTSFAGYSMFTVLTSSMEDEIPKGSLVITKNVDANSLKIGDDITYMSSETSTITHRIIAIVEKDEKTGKRAFETKGTMNEKADKDLVPSSNIVGKVVFHSKSLGDLAFFVSKNWPLIIFSLVVIFIFGGVVKKY